MTQSLLVLGASYSQIPLFKTAQRLGIRTVAATIRGSYAGIPYADEVLYCDITKPEEVLHAVRDRKIDAVTTCCMDVGTRTMGVLCRELSLPGPGIGAGAACDKSIQKALYQDAGVRTAPFRLIRSSGELQDACLALGFPVMLKAVDLTGSRGVFRADSMEEARKYYPLVCEQTGKGYCIVEKFLTGTMFGIEAMMNRGEPAFVLPLGNDLHDGNPPFPQGHHVPWEMAGDLYDQILEFTGQVSGALEFDNCAIDMDCMLSDGKLWIIEATPRAGATAITDMVGIHYGIDYFEAIIRCALGEDVSSMFSGRDRVPNAAWLIGADRAGTVEEIRIPAQIPPEVVDLSFNVKPGDRVRQFACGRDRIGQIIVKGNSARECRKMIDEMLRKTVIKVK